MKYAAIFAGLWLLTGVASSQGKYHHWISLFGGPTFVVLSPESPDLWRGTGNWGLSYGLGSSENGFWRATLRFDELVIDEKKFLESLSLDPSSYSSNGGSRTMFSLKLDAIYSPFQDTTGSPLYFAAGLGYLTLGSAELEITRTGFRLTGKKDSESALMVNAGLGLRYPILKRLACYAEVVYALASTSGRTMGYVPLRLGLSMDLTRQGG